jgi:UDP-N-acetylglucosamine transferase subunit ALG13
MSSIPDQRLAISDQRSPGRRPRVLALSSTGGHWIQMLRLQPAFEGCDVTYATTNADYQSDLKSERFRTIIDANRTQKFKLLLSALSILWVILRVRPDVILSTGAAPGFFAIRIGKLFGKKTIWVDSIANAEELSMSGHRVAKYADLWLTQWEHLAKPDGPHYFGNVLGEASEEAIANPKSLITNQKKSTEQILSTSEDKRSVISNQRLSTSDQGTEDGSQGLAISDQRLSNSDKRSAISDSTVTKIFVTVGSDVPFDRMVKIIDQWAAQNPNYDVFAQIGRTTWKPETLEYCQFLTPIEFTQKVSEADLIVAHAGMGSILTALKHQKTILVMPRRGYLGETRNEHQVATAEKLQEKCKIAVAFDENELAQNLDNLGAQSSSDRINLTVSKSLIHQLANFRLR